MTIGILIFSEPRDEVYAGADRLVEAGQTTGHTVVKLYEPHLSFICHPERSEGSPHDQEIPRHVTPRDDKKVLILHEGHPLPKLDVIISRPNFVEEPSLRTYAVQLLERAGYRIVNGNVGFTWAKNKLTQHVLFAKHGLPCPRWGIARKLDDAVALAKQIGFPAIVKVAFGTHGKGVFLAKDEESLWPIVDYLGIRDGNPMIVEEFIAEAKSSDIRVFVIGGKVVAAMQRTAAVGDTRANTSGGGTGSTIELTQEEQALAVRAAEIFELEIAGVDLIRSSRGSLILEINSNPGFRELEAVTGINIAKMIIEYATRAS
jgi:ribosomal protein S6--L-glutamate ligase